MIKCNALATRLLLALSLLVMAPLPLSAGAAQAAPVFSESTGSCPISYDSSWAQPYHETWLELKNTYYNPAALSEWDSWQHKFDCTLFGQTEYEKAMQSMVEAVGKNDQWTWYMSAAELKALQQMTTQGQTFIGMALHRANGVYRIDVLDYQSPAQKAGLKEGDPVVSINGKEIANMSEAEVNTLLFGKPSEKLLVDVIRDGRNKSVLLTFEYTKVAAVEARLLPGNVAYARLPDFEGSYIIRDLIEALSRLNSDAHGHLARIIFDLRYNHGGGFGGAQLVASLFLDGKDTLVATKLIRDAATVKGTPILVLDAANLTVLGKAVDPDLLKVLRSTRMFVLINGSTVSASEVVTGALKDNHRAKIYGKRSFGKGVGYVQHPVIDGVVSITTGAYRTPSGYDVAGKGIEPDVQVEQPDDDPQDEQLKSALEAD